MNAPIFHPYDKGEQLAADASRDRERARVVAILKRRAETAHVNTAFELRDAINEIEGRDCNDPRAVG